MNFPFDEHIILEDERALLRPLEVSDVSNLLEVATANDKLLQYSPALVNSDEHLTAYINTWIKEREKMTRYPFVIFDKHKNAYAGSTSFMNIANVHKRLEIGSTWIGDNFQRTGLNRHCKILLLQYAFEIAGAERVELLTDERNNTSRTAIEKIGAKFEGILRSHITMLDGFRRNTVVYSIIKSEWPEVKKHLANAIMDI